MPQEIVIEIDEFGNVTVEGKGFVGPECEHLTADLEAALGAVEKRTLKPEYRRAKPVLRKVGA